MYDVKCYAFLVVPVRPSGRTLFTNTVTDAKVLHPSMTSFSIQTPAVMSTATVMASSSNSRYGSGIISRLDSSLQSGLSGLFEDQSSTTTKPLPVHVGVVTKTRLSSTAQPFNGNAPKVVTSKSGSLGFVTNSQPRSSIISFTSQTFTTPTRTGSMISSYTSGPQPDPLTKTNAVVSLSPAPSNQSYGILSNFYNYMRPGPATTTTPSGISSLVSDVVYGDRKVTRSAYGRWQSP